MATGYVLDLKPRKKHVFVTQLSDEADEDDSKNIIKVPIITKQREHLLRQGINTLQSTLLLKQNADLAIIESELEEKRIEFRERIDNCHQKETKLIRRQEMIKDKVSKFERFVADNDAKRKRAMAKFNQERIHNNRKSQEIEMLKKELESLTDRLKYINKRVEGLSKFHFYLLKSASLSKEDSSLVDDGMIDSLIMQHKTLTATNQLLTKKLEINNNEIEMHQMNLQLMSAEHINSVLGYGNKIASLQGKIDRLINENAKLEERTINAKLAHRKEGENIGQIKLAIENIAEKCYFRNNTTTTTTTTTTYIYQSKLDAIKGYISEREHIVSCVLEMDKQKLRK